MIKTVNEGIEKLEAGLISEAIDIFEAHPNDAEALNLLGEIYYHGIETEKCYDKARTYHFQAALRESSNSFYRLGVMFLEGIGTSKNNDIGLLFMQEAANRNLNSAINFMGDAYGSGMYVEKDTDKALEYYEKAANNDSAKGLYSVGLMYYHEHYNRLDFKKAYDIFKEGVLKYDFAKSHYMLGLMHLKAQFVEKDENLGFHYIKEAAYKGDATALVSAAQLYLFSYYEEPFAVEQALEYLIDAHLKGNKRAIEFLDGLAEISYYSIKELNFEDSAYYENYSDIYQTVKNHEETMVFVQARLKIEGISVDEDFDTGIDWLIKLANNDHIMSSYVIGKFHHYGRYTDKDFEKAASSFVKCIKGDCKLAALGLIDLYENGYETEALNKDFIHTLKIYIKEKRFWG